MEIVKYLLSSQNIRLDINQLDCHGVNCFWVAAYHNFHHMLNLLMVNGCNMKVTNEIGSNSLHIAVKRRHKESVDTLIKLGFPLDEPKSNGVTALGIAVHNDDLEIIDMLIKGGADLNKVSV